MSLNETTERAPYYHMCWWKRYTGVHPCDLRVSPVFVYFGEWGCHRDSIHGRLLQGVLVLKYQQTHHSRPSE